MYYMGEKRIKTPNDWMMYGETGTSSKTIWAVMMGQVTEPRYCDGHYYNTPQDPADFGRCYTLLALFPEWNNRLDEVAQVFPKWKPYIDNWEKLTWMYGKAIMSTGGSSAPKLLEFMQGLNEGAMILDGYVRTGPGSWKREEPKPLVFCECSKSMAIRGWLEVDTRYIDRDYKTVGYFLITSQGKKVNINYCPICGSPIREQKEKPEEIKAGVLEVTLSSKTPKNPSDSGQNPNWPKKYEY